MDRPWLHQVDGICVLCVGERNERRFGQRRRDPHSLTFQGIGLVRGIIAHRWPAHSLSGLTVRRIWRIAW
ncbi:hypothetical protein OROGR_032317 [Orobanche gracilis]